MYKNSYYRLMIASALAMASSTMHAMLLTEWCKAKKQKPERLEFKTARDIPRVTKFDYRGFGFIAGCAQQYVCTSQIVSPNRTEPMPSALFAGLCMQFPGAMMAALCLSGYYKGVIDGLRTHDDHAIGVVFNQLHPLQPCEQFYERDLRRKEFLESYKNMRAGKVKVDPQVVAAHNAVIERCIKYRSFFQGYGIGSAVGFPAAIMLLACMHSMPK